MSAQRGRCTALKGTQMQTHMHACTRVANQQGPWREAAPELCTVNVKYQVSLCFFSYCVTRFPACSSCVALWDRCVTFPKHVWSVCAQSYAGASARLFCMCAFSGGLTAHLHRGTFAIM